LELFDAKEQIEIFDYRADKNIKSLEIWLEAYQKGQEMQILSSSRNNVDDGEGRVAVIKDEQKDGKWLIVHQNKNGKSSHGFNANVSTESGQYGSICTGKLDDARELKTGQEIILFIYIAQQGNDVSIYSPEYYEENSDAVKNYDLIYLLKCKFYEESI
jgi:hypothetical protein